MNLTTDYDHDKLFAPPMRITTRRPRIYFGGKISANGWRDPIIGDASGISGTCHTGSDDDTPEQLFDPDHTVDCGEWIYGGPFFIACDHSCHHSPNAHGTIDSSDDDARRRQIHRNIFDINLERIRRADYIFCFLDELDAFGTLVEIGHAQAWGKRLVVAFGPNVKPDQLWMACERATVLRGSASATWRTFARTIMSEVIVVENTKGAA